MLLVNGPLARRINLNCDVNVLGQGWRANATIGRALRLLLQNHGNAYPGQNDMATLGQPAKYTFCLGENEEASPWQSLAVDLGGAPGVDYVTAIPANGVLEIRDSDSNNAEDLLFTLSRALVLPSLTGPSATALLDSVMTLVLCPEHAHILSEAGLSKTDLQERLWQTARIRGTDLSRSVRLTLEGIRKEKGLPASIDNLPMTRGPEDILILVAGGPGRKSAVIPGWGSSKPVSIRVRVTRALQEGLQTNTQ